MTRNLSKIKNSLLKLLNGEALDDVSLDNNKDETVLCIVFDAKILGYLSFNKDTKEFSLKYTNEFNNSGFPPFHLSRSEWGEFKFDPGKTYYSRELWYPFAKRIPNPNRPDFDKEFAKAGFTGDENELEILGKLSDSSISQSWKFELRGDKRA